VDPSHPTALIPSHFALLSVVIHQPCHLSRLVHVDPFAMKTQQRPLPEANMELSQPSLRQVPCRPCGNIRGIFQFRDSRSFSYSLAFAQYISLSSALTVSALIKHRGKKRKGKHRDDGGSLTTMRGWLDHTLTNVCHRCLFEEPYSLRSY
jgi:hypothetical protein